MGPVRALQRTPKSPRRETSTRDRCAHDAPSRTWPSPPTGPCDAGSTTPSPPRCRIESPGRPGPGGPGAWARPPDVPAATGKCAGYRPRRRRTGDRRRAATAAWAEGHVPQGRVHVGRPEVHGVRRAVALDDAAPDGAWHHVAHRQGVLRMHGGRKPGGAAGRRLRRQSWYSSGRARRSALYSERAPGTSRRVRKSRYSAREPRAASGTMTRLCRAPTSTRGSAAAGPITDVSRFERFRWRDGARAGGMHRRPGSQPVRVALQVRHDAAHHPHGVVRRPQRTDGARASAGNVQ